MLAPKNSDQLSMLEGSGSVGTPALFNPRLSLQTAFVVSAPHPD